MGSIDFKSTLTELACTCSWTCVLKNGLIKAWANFFMQQPNSRNNLHLHYEKLKLPWYDRANLTFRTSRLHSFLHALCRVFSFGQFWDNENRPHAPTDYAPLWCQYKQHGRFSTRELRLGEWLGISCFHECQVIISHHKDDAGWSTKERGELSNLWTHVAAILRSLCLVHVKV